MLMPVSYTHLDVYKRQGFNGYKVPGYYYSKKGLINDLMTAGFEDVEVYSLEEYYACRLYTSRCV